MFMWSFGSLLAGVFCFSVVPPSALLKPVRENKLEFLCGGRRRNSTVGISHEIERTRFREL